MRYYGICARGRISFLLAYEDHRSRYDYGHWMTIELSTGGSINSVQNGILRQLFDGYDVSINPNVRMPYFFMRCRWLIVLR